MRYSPLPADLFVENRKRLVSLLEPESLVVLPGNDMMPTNADGVMRYYQNSDLFYLTGVDQEETILVIAPDTHDEKLREVLFLRETSEQITIWEGAKLTKEQAREQTGIENIQWLSEFPRIFRDLMVSSQRVYLNSNEHARAGDLVESRHLRFIRDCQKQYPLHRYERLALLMQQLRCVKSEDELETLTEACRITRSGFMRLLKFVKPGVTEYEIEAELAHEFLRQRSRGFAYLPIIASGKNACALHYIDNHSICADGDLLLLDVAAEYANYNADLTRTIPVNGIYSDRQRAVYDAVLRVMRAAMGILVPGKMIKDYQGEVGQLMEDELIGLGLLDPNEVKEQDPDKPLYKKYFMHGTSHHLGLDVHDVGLASTPVKPGMVFTVEPGIYIPDEGLGVRLENDIVITEDGYVDLMEDIPIEADEIEEIMAES